MFWKERGGRRDGGRRGGGVKGERGWGRETLPKPARHQKRPRGSTPHKRRSALAPSFIILGLRREWSFASHSRCGSTLFRHIRTLHNGRSRRGRRPMDNIRSRRRAGCIFQLSNSSCKGNHSGYLEQKCGVWGHPSWVITCSSARTSFAREHSCVTSFSVKPSRFFSRVICGSVQCARER
jgi:hypothetical protein